MPLTDTRIRTAKPTEKTQKLFDGNGLFLEITPQGSKRWRLKYRFAGKAKLISLGIYPEVSLKDARDKKDEARKLLASDLDPSAQRKAKKLHLANSHTNGFESIAMEWISTKHVNSAASHRENIEKRLRRNVFPYIGNRPITEIAPPELLELLRRIEQRGANETAHRVMSNCGQIFRYAIATCRATIDPTRSLVGALQPAQDKHLPAITDPTEVKTLLHMIDSYRGSPIVTAALRIAPLVFVRPGELRQWKWAEIDWDHAQWAYFITKTKTDHIVPLSRQSIAILKEIQPITGSGEYVFPSARTFKRPMSENAVLSALRSLGIPKEVMCGHGFRAMARTILDEILKFRPDYIEHQLAHNVRDPLGRAYNRTSHLTERIEMMQKWADYLDQLKSEK